MTKEIQLTQDQVSLVDDADYEWLNQWQWHAVRSGNTFYAARYETTKNGKQRLILMHEEIMERMNRQ